MVKEGRESARVREAERREDSQAKKGERNETSKGGGRTIDRI